MTQIVNRMNGGCGYVLKPKCMLTQRDSNPGRKTEENGTNLKEDMSANPRSIDLRTTNRQLLLTILSAHYLPDSSVYPNEREHPFVEVCFRGMFADAVVHRTGPIVNDR